MARWLGDRVVIVREGIPEGQLTPYTGEPLDVAMGWSFFMTMTMDAVCVCACGWDRLGWAGWESLVDSCPLTLCERDWVMIGWLMTTENKVDIFAMNAVRTL